MRFSVVIPTRDRIDLLSACLSALGEVDYRGNEFEVIVVDDAGKVPAGQAAQPTPAGLAVRFLRLEQNGGPGAARNFGASHAAGERLIFMDDDCRARPDLLRELDRILDESPDILVGCRVESIPRQRLTAAAAQAILDAVYRHLNPDPRDARVFTGTCLAIRAGAFHAVGGFDASRRTYEDYEFCGRCRSKGVRLMYAPEARVLHYTPAGIGIFWKRHYRYGRGAYRFHKESAVRALDHAKRAGFCLRLVAAGWWNSAPLRGTAVAALIALSQIASGAGFLSAWREAQGSKGRSR